MSTDNSDLDQKALSLFERSLEQPSETREAWLREQTSNHSALREQVLALFHNDRSEDGGLQTGGAVHEINEQDEKVPDEIGQYKVVRLIGRGGMGVVYLGERSKGDFDHRAAIKVVRGVKRSAKLAERLRRERQTLANLQHPGIAQLFDGGETADGEPYFVMEYVEGASLKGYLKAATPTCDDRVKLCRDICIAVQYAHQKLIIHRDLSSNNILVTDEGQAKLIDFGISRSLSDEETSNAPNYTMTIDYAAPERLNGEAATTLSDIFSLGVILRELMAVAPEVVDADLSAIYEKAAHTDPAQRYQSASALIADLDRYRQGEPVTARGGGALYTFGKFFKRRTLAVSAAAIVLTGVVVALGVVTTLYQRAEIARADADTRFSEVRELANFLLFDLYDELVAIPGTTKALSNIADKSREYLDTLNADARATNDLHLETATGYHRLGNVVGNPIGANLGRRKEAGELLKIAYDKLKVLYETTPDNIATVRALGDTSFSLSVYEFIAIDDSHAAIDYAKEAEKYFAIVAASDEATLKDKIKKIESKSQSGKPLTWIDQGDMAITVIDEARRETLALLEIYPDDVEVKRLSAVIHTALAEVMGQHFYVAGGDYATALPHHDTSIGLYNEIAQADPENSGARRNLPAAYYKRALIYYGMEDDQRAIEDLEIAEGIANEFLTKDPEDFGIRRILSAVHEQLAVTLVRVGRAEEAITLVMARVEEVSAWSANEPENLGLFRDVAMIEYLAGDVHDNANNKAEACALYRSSMTRFDEIETRGGEVTVYDRETALAAIKERLAKC